MHLGVPHILSLHILKQDARGDQARQPAIAGKGQTHNDRGAHTAQANSGHCHLLAGYGVPRQVHALQPRKLHQLGCGGWAGQPSGRPPRPPQLATPAPDVVLLFVQGPPHADVHTPVRVQRISTGPLALQVTGLLACVQGVTTAQPMMAHAARVNNRGRWCMYRRAVCQMPNADPPLCQPLPKLEALTSLLLVTSTCRMQVMGCKHPLLKVQHWHGAPLHPLRPLATASHNVQMLGRM